MPFASVKFLCTRRYIDKPYVSDQFEVKRFLLQKLARLLVKKYGLVIWRKGFATKLF